MQNSKVAIITGGGSGLGLSSAELLLEKGYKVAIWDRKSALPTSENCIFCEVDVTNSESISKALALTLTEFSKVDVLLNSAGIAIAISTL